MGDTKSKIDVIIFTDYKPRESKPIPTRWKYMYRNKNTGESKETHHICHYLDWVYDGKI